MMLRSFSLLSVATHATCHPARSAPLAAGLLALLTLMSSAALAQTNAPLTGDADSTLPARPVVRQVNTPMPVSGADTAAPPQGPAFAEPRPSAATPAPVDVGPTGTGGITRALLAAQGDGRRAAPAQPMLGVVATAAFDRYLDSFKLPIPQWFQERVKTDQSQ